MATARHGAHGNGRATVRAVASTLRAALRAPPQQARPEKTYDKRRPAACRRAGRAAKRPTSKAETARFAGQDGLFRTAIRRLLQLTEAQAVMPDGHGANKHLQFHHATTGGHGRREPANERKKTYHKTAVFSFLFITFAKDKRRQGNCGRADAHADNAFPHAGSIFAGNKLYRRHEEKRRQTRRLN